MNKKMSLCFLLPMCFLLMGWPVLSRASTDAEIIYGISPYYFSRNFIATPFSEIQRRLPELKSLGVTIVWLQPVFKSAEPGQGYDTVDYFKLNPGFGTEEQFENLVETAHQLKIKVVLDIAINHTPLAHPWAQDILVNGTDSEFYSFYQHEKKSGIPYAKFFHVRREAGIPFIYYFWDKLLNLNFENEDLRKNVVDILSFWIRQYDIDGYRFDAGWGPSSRWEGFYPEISQNLRKIKTGLILITEDGAQAKAGRKHRDLLPGSGFDFAYDWSGESSDWISKWAFQMGDEPEKTVFNAEPADAARDFIRTLKLEISQKRISAARYLENNDTASFLETHSEDETKFAATVMALLPGGFMMFSGQPEGRAHAQWDLPSLDPSRTLRSYNESLWDFYQNLIQRKKNLGATYRVTAVTAVNDTQVLITIDKKLNLLVDFSNRECSFSDTH